MGGAGALPRAVTMYNHADPSTIPDRAHPPGRLAGAWRLRAGVRGATMHNDDARRIIPTRAVALPCCQPAVPTRRYPAAR